MATSSITETVYIKDKKHIAQFVKALESSKAHSAKQVSYSRSVEKLDDAEDILRIFGASDNDGI